MSAGRVSLLQRGRRAGELGPGRRRGDVVLGQQLGVVVERHRARVARHGVHRGPLAGFLEGPRHGVALVLVRAVRHEVDHVVGDLERRQFVELDLGHVGRARPGLAGVSELRVLGSARAYVLLGDADGGVGLVELRDGPEFPAKSVSVEPRSTDVHSAAPARQGFYNYSSTASWTLLYMHHSLEFGAAWRGPGGSFLLTLFLGPLRTMWALRLSIFSIINFPLLAFGLDYQLLLWHRHPRSLDRRTICSSEQP